MKRSWSDHNIPKFWVKEGNMRLEQSRQMTHTGNKILDEVSERGREKFIEYGWSARRLRKKFIEKFRKVEKKEMILEMLEPCPNIMLEQPRLITTTIPHEDPSPHNSTRHSVNSTMHSPLKQKLENVGEGGGSQRELI